MREAMLWLLWRVLPGEAEKIAAIRGSRKPHSR